MSIKYESVNIYNYLNLLLVFRELDVIIDLTEGSDIMESLPSCYLYLKSLSGGIYGKRNKGIGRK